jgi:hypothetical protein
VENRETRIPLQPFRKPVELGPAAGADWGCVADSVETISGAATSVLLSQYRLSGIPCNEVLLVG